MRHTSRRRYATKRYPQPGPAVHRLQALGQFGNRCIICQEKFNESRPGTVSQLDFELILHDDACYETWRRVIDAWLAELGRRYQRRDRERLARALTSDSGPLASATGSSHHLNLAAQSLY